MTKTSDHTMIRIDKDLIKQIRIAAAYQEQSMVAWVDSTLREAVKHQLQKRKSA